MRERVERSRRGVRERGGGEKYNHNTQNLGNIISHFPLSHLIGWEQAAHVPCLSVSLAATDGVSC